MISPARKCLFLIIALISCCFSAFAQSVHISNERAEALIEQAEKAGFALSIYNGFVIKDKDGARPLMDHNNYVTSRQMTHFTLSLLAMRLVDKGHMTLDMPLYTIFPDYDDLGEYFAVPITPRHLMAQMAGFTTPLFYSQPMADLKPVARDFSDYIKTIRGAGEKPHDDIVATVLLVQTMERVTGQSLGQLITDHLLEPLGFQSTAIAKYAASHHPAPFDTIDLKIKQSVILKLSGIFTSRLRDKDRQPFLSEAMMKAFHEQILYAHHPMGLLKTMGLSQYAIDGQILNTTTYECHANNKKGTEIFTINNGPTVFMLQQRTGDRCLLTGIKALAKSMIENDITGPAKSENFIRLEQMANALQVSPKHTQGIYLNDQNPSHWFADRHARIKDKTLTIQLLNGDNQIAITQTGSKSVTIYHKKGAYHFESAEGSQLLFSKFMDGGYIDLDGIPYRHIGPMGDRWLMITLYPVVIALLLTSAVYWKSPLGAGWQRMGRILSVSTIIFAICVELERRYAAHLYYYADMAWVITLWRIPLNLAMMGLFTMPFFAMKITRTNQMPTQILKSLLINVHLTLLSAGAVALFLWAMAINISGNFIP